MNHRRRSPAQVIEEVAHIFLHAIEGISSFQTMRVMGYHGKRTLQILINSGSTHNVLDEEMAKFLGCKLEAIPPVCVTIADGNKVKTRDVVRNFEWKILNTVYKENFMIIPLGGCHMVLGV